ncbi:MAG: cysteine--tRNA ligase [Nitrospirae bacterium RBG_16_64_22]|nr:MAG: cysteine--tRNA ligase [Nitrospirae bacterium RBG_16_64_22]
MSEAHPIRIFNSLTGRKETFVPLVPGRVGMYVCGVTVYDHCHLGHARSAIVFDAIRATLVNRGYEVHYVQNFTDIDDKIIRRAREEGKTSEEIAAAYTSSYHEDMDRLGVKRPDVEPLATGHIPEMILIISALIEKGAAYAAGGDVLFRVKKFPSYGALSKRSLDEMLAGARVEVSEIKEDPLDFVLWKASKPGEPAWPSPWGPGRPGWHIECSAMAMKHLGQTIDIHGGGHDLLFPHHENEIAQSEAYTGRSFVRIWVHNGFLNINREKMSKSLGNFFTIKEVLARFDPEVVRLFLLSTHYRHPIEFSDQSLRDSRSALDRMYRFLDLLARSREEAPRPFGVGGEKDILDRIRDFEGRFDEAMSDDFNTPLALGSLFDLVREMNRHLVSERSQGRRVSTGSLDLAEDAVRRAGKVLGLFRHDPRAWLEGAGGPDGDERRPEVERLVAERTAARKARDFALADEIRRRLEETYAVVLDDGPGGTTWRRKAEGGNGEPGTRGMGESANG